jgi:hypothetical protein
MGNACEEGFAFSGRGGFPLKACGNDDRTKCMFDSAVFINGKLQDVKHWVEFV